ncbi:D-alanyl-D-alanine carboxypeptidase family protein [Paracoccus sp. 2205BS29-5]|uniref:D-alanyl-D-alanine carboxypeptidase family protein n=2 Tax=Paracoccus spongiarum TaxID=3064387 RepID=A0ABT9JDN0_9RHOB|nr:D-alanyl-D-alanine carboxypeptidase family protein [Paracoccus sp. 2205BS29-5]MDP5307931.1 D-alanyl-D-alanine carboxypeptidase family protein [Paracoccus sp. 2205BS29-5]
MLAGMAPASLSAAPFAAFVMDARTGQPIYTQNADTRLHPASLTKMMTLYMAFTAIERGQVRLDSRFTVSSNAAAEPPSKLGLRAGQQIELRYLLRAAAIKSANDAATTIGEGLAGSEAAFGQQMTAMARALGMRNTQFRNAHGLTQEGHYSTAQDMSILGRRLFYDFPQYYNLFSRRSADAGIAQVSSTNKRFLDGYAGADGIKTGYTRAAGFNLTASAQRGNKRLIATVFGGTSTAQRNQVMGQLLDAGFSRVPNRVREQRPAPPQMLAQKVVRRAQVAPKPVATQPQRLVLQSSEAPARVTRPAAAASTAAVATRDALADAMRQAQTAPLSGSALRLASSARPRLRPGAAPAAVEAAVQQAVAAAPATQPAPATARSASLAAPVLAASSRPAPAPRSRAAPGRGSTAAIAATADGQADAIAQAVAEAGAAPQDGDSLSLLASPAPKRRSETVILAAMGEGDISNPAALEVVSRGPDSGRKWGVVLGRYRSQAEAETLLLRVALQDGAVLEGAGRSVADTRRGFEARFVNLSKADANLTCERMMARSQTCQVTGP